MPCTCRRVTYRYACRHKEREFERCWRYQLRLSFPCMDMVLASCETEVIRIAVPRVCSKCFGFFLITYGRNAAVHVSQKFLEFKANNEFRRDAIDPATVPPEAYISSAELATLNSPSPHQTRQPFGPGSPMRAAPSRGLPPMDIQRPKPAVTRSRHGDREQSRSHQSHSKKQSKSPKPSKKPPIRRKPVPARSKISKEVISRPVPRTPPPDIGPAPTGGSNLECHLAVLDINVPIDLFDLVENKHDDHVHTGVITCDRTSLKQAPRAPPNSSFAKRITQMAESAKIMDCTNPGRKRMPRVPKLRKAPKVPTWRVETPSAKPNTPSVDVKGKRVKGRSKSAVALSRTQDLSPLPMDQIPATATATYVVRSKSSSEALADPTTASMRDDLRIPPPRTGGLKSFREKGIPSAAVMLEENAGEQSPAVLVSVSTPSPAYSCAVQSCYCSSDEGETDVCLSCQERRDLEHKLQSKWI